jgi:ribonuclease-3
MPSDGWNIDAIESRIGHRFEDRALLRTALTHPSYAAEHPGTPSYDRLEFLGDAVLALIVADQLYRTLPDEPEGDLTRRMQGVVAGESLARAALRLDLGQDIRLGKGAAADGERVRSSVLENAMEALIGALYLDAGIDAARSFVLDHLGPDTHDSAGLLADPKSALQQHTQAHGGTLPHYRITEVTGPAHRRVFHAEVVVGGVVAGAGEGATKQAAQKAAARAALEAIQGSGHAAGAGGVRDPL